MKTRIKEHIGTRFDEKKGRKTQRTYYTVQYKRGLFWHTVSRLGVLGTVYQIEFPSRRAAEKCREYMEQTGQTWFADNRMQAK